MWVLDVAMSKYSFNSSANKHELLANMFSDREGAMEKQTVTSIIIRWCKCKSVFSQDTWGEKKR